MTDSEFNVLLGAVFALPVAFTAVYAPIPGVGKLRSVGGIFIDVLSMLLIGIFAVGGAVSIGGRLAVWTLHPYMAAVPMALFCLVGIRFMILERIRLDRQRPVEITTTDAPV